MKVTKSVGVCCLLIYHDQACLCHRRQLEYWLGGLTMAQEAPEKLTLIFVALMCLFLNHFIILIMLISLYICFQCYIIWKSWQGEAILWFYNYISSISWLWIFQRMEKQWMYGRWFTIWLESGLLTLSYVINDIYLISVFQAAAVSCLDFRQFMIQEVYLFSYL